MTSLDEFKDLGVSVDDHEVREHMTLIGRMEKAVATREILRRGGWRITVAAAYSDDQRWPPVDASKFRYVCERSLGEE